MINYYIIARARGHIWICMHLVYTVILNNDLVVLEFTFICGCKWIFDVIAAVIFTGSVG